MNRWASNLYRKQGKEKGIDEKTIEKSLKQAHILQDNGFPAILTLNHLAFHTGIKYHWLRKIVSRDIDPYRTFAISKRSGGKRYINIPNKHLMTLQRWVDQHILSQLSVSPYSYAFSQGQSIVDCAQQHLGCNWIIKIDLRHFFESLSEIQVYHVFSDIGYDNLISFEMARLCTKVTRLSSNKYKNKRWVSHFESPIEDYNDKRVGHLPQGAPTSPKLSNIIIKDLDLEINKIAAKNDLSFTRYADDITFSINSDQFSRKKGVGIINSIYSLLPKYGVRPNPQKAKIIPPGARKIVLGLLVDTNKVRLSRSFRRKLECHFYHCNKDPLAHATSRGFNSIIGLKNYIKGLIAYAEQVDSDYVSKLRNEYGNINWPI